jgi:hypothetical protein
MSIRQSFPRQKRKPDSDAADIPGHKKSKTSRHRGVSYHRNKRKWTAQIYFDGKNRTLGYFTDEDAAAAAYVAACQKLGRRWQFLTPEEKQIQEAECREKYRDTLKGFIKRAVYNSRQNNKKRNVRGRDHDHDIDAPFMIDLFTKQGGRCALSGIVMVHKRMSHWQASIDRIDNDLGYVRGNVRWVCLEFNGPAQWTPAKIALARAPPLESTVDDVEAVCASMRQKPSWTVKNRRKLRTQSCPTTGTTLHECRSCDQFLPVDAFGKRLSSGCKQCQKRKKRAYKATPRGKLLQMLKDAKNRSKVRILKDTCRDNESPFTLTLNDLVEIYAAQRGVCAYSGLPLDFGQGDWMISLERLDPKRNYSRTNCALVCHEFNPMDQSVRREGVESLGWSVEKMRMFRMAQ